MTRKERPKVRAREATPPPIDALIDAGTVRVEGPAPVTPEAFQAAYGGLGGAGKVSITAIDGVFYGGSSGGGGSTNAEEGPRDTDPRDFDLQAASALPGLEAAEAAGKALASLEAKVDALGDTTLELARAIPVPVELDAFRFEPLWSDRLAQMAKLARQTPQQYLETLVRRAWCAVPMRMRGSL